VGRRPFDATRQRANAGSWSRYVAPAPQATTQSSSISTGFTSGRASAISHRGERQEATRHRDARGPRVRAVHPPGLGQEDHRAEGDCAEQHDGDPSAQHAPSTSATRAAKADAHGHAARGGQERRLARQAAAPWPGVRAPDQPHRHVGGRHVHATLDTPGRQGDVRQQDQQLVVPPGAVDAGLRGRQTGGHVRHRQHGRILLVCGGVSQGCGMGSAPGHEWQARRRRHRLRSRP
jgi:hypothetical protein